MKLQRSRPLFRIAANVQCMILMCAAAGLAAQNSDDEPAEDVEPSGAELSDAGNDGAGVFHLNQSAADATNQDNVLSVSAIQDSGAAISDATSSQSALTSSAELSNQFSGSDATIADVANAASGVVGINQSTAAGSSQGNLMALAVSSDPASLAYASAFSSATSSPVSMAGVAAVPDVTMTNVGNAATGAIQANQLAGTGGQQSNLVALAIAGEGAALADATAQHSRAADAEASGEMAYPALNATATLRDSFNGATGLVQVNQATGGFNSQTNLIAAAFGAFADASAISETGLGDVRAPATSAADADHVAPEGLADARGSFEGFVGVGQVSQVVGYNNQTANTISVSVGVIPAGS